MSEAMNSVKAQQFVPPATNGTGSTQASDAAKNLPKAPAPGTAAQQATSFTADPAQTLTIQSKVVQRLVDQKASVYGPGLAQVPLPARGEDDPLVAPKKPANPMTPARSLEGGSSPLAPLPLADGARSAAMVGERPDDLGEANVVANAEAGAEAMPTRNGLVLYTQTSRGDTAYLTQDRLLHIMENHITVPPSVRGKRMQTYFPVNYALNAPTMSVDDVKQAIATTVQQGILKNDVKDTRTAEYRFPQEYHEQTGLSEMKVSMAPDGLILSAYPSYGDNVFAVREISPEEQAELEAAQAAQGAQAAPDGDDRMFRTNVASTSFG